MYILNEEGFKNLSNYSGNPFLDALVDMQGIVSTLAEAQHYKPFIAKYSDTSLSDLKDKIKANLPEAVDKDGNINFAKLEELAVNGNPLAEHILTIKQHRENLANAPLGGKIEAIKNDAIRDIISGNKLTKEAGVLKKMQQLDDYLKNSNMPDWAKALFSLNKEAFLGDPKLFAAFTALFSDQQATQDNSNNFFNTPAPQSIQSAFNQQTNNILQSLTPKPNSNEAENIKSIIENNPSQEQTPSAERKKKAITKLKQIVETKKKQKQNTQPKQEQPQQPTTTQPLGITFPYPSSNLPILPYENILPKITTLW